MPVTFTGVDALVVVPLPSSPSKLMPQQRTPPAVRVAHEWANPLEMVVAVAIPDT